jgi:hypothetical protein
MFTISPLWTGETCRPELRGFFLCFFNTSIVLGQFAMFVFILAVPVNCALIPSQCRRSEREQLPDW